MSRGYELLLIEGQIKKKCLLFPGKSLIGEGKRERPGSKFLLAKIDNIALRHNDFTHNDFTSALL